MSQTPTEADLALALYNKLLSSPETRTETLKLFKKVNPNVAIPEIDAANPVLKEVDGLKEELKALQKKLDEEKLDGKLQNTVTKLKAERGFTDEGMQAIIKLAAEKSIPDLEVAADHYERNLPKPEPVVDTGYRPTHMFSQTDDTTKNWLENRDEMREGAIMDTLKDIRAGKI